MYAIKQNIIPNKHQQALVKVENKYDSFQKQKNYTPIIAQILAKITRAENRNNAMQKYLAVISDIQKNKQKYPLKINKNI